MSTKFPRTHSSCKDSRLMTLGCETIVSKFVSATEGCDQESTQMPESHRDKFKTIRKTETENSCSNIFEQEIISLP